MRPAPTPAVCGLAVRRDENEMELDVVEVVDPKLGGGVGSAYAGTGRVGVGDFAVIDDPNVLGRASGDGTIVDLTDGARARTR
jgi:hypothetical protein